MYNNFNSRRFVPDEYSYSQQYPERQTNQTYLDQSMQNQTYNDKQYYYSMYQCEAHQGETISNFCSNLECLTPLCPECLDSHFKMHINYQSSPDIESIKNVRNNCSKKLKAAVIQLTNEMEKAEMQYLTNPEMVIEDNLLKIRRIKERVYQMVDNFFDQQEDILKKKINENVLKATDFQPVFEKIKQLVQELEILNNNLDTGNQISVVRKICLLDLKSMMDKFKSDIHRVIDSKDLDPISVITDDNWFTNIQHSLSRLVQVSKIASDYHKHEVNTTVNTSQLDSFVIQQKSNQNILNNSLLPQNKQNQSILQQQSLQNLTQPQRQQSISQAPLIPQSPVRKQQSGNSSFSSQKNVAQSPKLINIRMQDYFSQELQQKTMHFFLAEEKLNKLYICNLASHTPRFQIIDVQNENSIPYFHKSIAAPNGDIYLTGGRQQDGEKSRWVYKFDFQRRQLVYHKNIFRQLLEIGQLAVARSSHGICWINNCIYVVGGFTNNQKMTSTVERFDVTTNTCEQLQNLNFAASSLCCTAFNGEQIFKFGGIGENRKLSPYIEKYSLIQDKWTIIDPKISQFENPLNFALLSTSCCIQINKTDILVFGGYTETNVAQKSTYVLSVDEKDDNNYTIRCINWNMLPMAEGFWNNTAVVLDNCVYALQNVACHNTNNCLENDRKIIQFNGKEWRVLN